MCVVPPQATSSTATEHAVHTATELAPGLTLSSKHRVSTATEHAVDAATELAAELTLSSEHRTLPEGLARVCSLSSSLVLQRMGYHRK